MNYYNQIKEKLIENETYEQVKDYSKERHRVITYFEIGRILTLAGKHYGEKIIDEYSKKLVADVGKKYDKKTLFRMKQFYTIFSNEKVATSERQLFWSHYKVLIPLKDYNKINYYISQTIKRNLSKRQLEVIIKSNEYERLPESTKDKLINKEDLEVKDLIPNPVLIKNNNYECVSEKILQKLILEDISSFLKQLGEGFCFIDNEYKIKIGYTYNYIDILLFNIKYNCYIVVELKVTELKKEHIGQIEVYMNYIDNNVKTLNHNKTIGIIICRKDNKYIIEYSSDKRILATTYKIV